MAGKRKTKIDWQAAHEEFIRTKNYSLADIAKIYGISHSSVLKVSMNEGWVKEKEKIWGEAAKEALEEVEGSIKDLLKRHAKVARYLQAGGLKNLKLLLDEVEETIKDASPEEARKILKSLILNKIISSSTLTTMIAEGLKAERELYPKQLQLKGDLSVELEGLSKELEEAIYESFRRKIGRKRPSIHPSGSQKAKSKKR